MKLTRGRALFLVLQLLDLLTTAFVFRLGGFETNFAVAYLIRHLGLPAGLLVSKAACVGFILPLKKLLWVANTIFSLIVGWNMLIITLLLLRG